MGGDHETRYRHHTRGERAARRHDGHGPGAAFAHRAACWIQNTGWDILFGFESRRGVTHPYVEGRVLNHSGSAFQLAVGLNFTLV
jgi:hypothetical protein